MRAWHGRSSRKTFGTPTPTTSSGLCYEAEGKTELATRELKTVNQLGKFDEIRYRLEFRKKNSRIIHEINQSEEALKEYLLLVKKTRRNAEYYFLIGSLFEKRSRRIRRDLL
jgi:hypothetical protein